MRPNKKIDTKLSSAAVRARWASSRHEPHALAQRAICSAASSWACPRARPWRTSLGLHRALAGGLLRDLAPCDAAADLQADPSTPLWFYILREAELAPQNGQRLGPVGGRIVAEVFIGLLLADPTSYLSQWPKWRPNKEQFPLPKTGTFDMTDLLTFSRVRPQLSRERRLPAAIQFLDPHLIARRASGSGAGS